jgi:hypothetical protein
MLGTVGATKEKFHHGFAALATLLTLIFFLSIPVCWAAGALYGVSARLASDAFYLVFILLYAGVLVLPWLNLPGQRNMTRGQRLGKMCVAWLCLEIAAACFWSGPWLLFPQHIIAGKGEMWSYSWWAYMAGGDARYTVADPSLIAMEKMGVLVACACAIVLLRRLATGRFTDTQLWTLMFVQAVEFGVISVYYVSGFYLDLSSLGGLSEIIIKFVGSNIFWLLMPPVVFFWAGRNLIAHRQTPECLELDAEKAPSPNA